MLRCVGPAVTGKGVVDFIPMWDTTGDIVDSVIFQKTSHIGINTTAPAATLDVNGKSDIRDTLTLFPKSTDSTLVVNGTSFKVDSAGKVTFITGQTFPGAGTITGVTTASGSGLSGGGSTGTLSLKVSTAGITNTMLANSNIMLNANTSGGITTPGTMSLGSTYTIGLKPCSPNQVLQYSGTAWNCTAAGSGTITGVTAGIALTGGGTSGGITLNLDTSKVPLLAASNIFSAPQTINSSTNFVALNVSDTGGGNGIQTFVNNASGYGVYGGNSSSGTGVGGNSSSGTGVAGSSTNGHGVAGQTSGGNLAAGVSGINSGSGFGVLGQATGSSGQGVWGESFGSGNNGLAGADGVHGVAHTTGGSGAAGVNTSQDGIGVYGSDTSGYGFYTDSHAHQDRYAGGWVKAMVYFQPTNGGIQRCFNSQLPGSQATTVPCGITFAYLGPGNYTLDFGFEVDDRFASLTAQTFFYGGDVMSLCDICGASSTQLYVVVCSGNAPCNGKDDASGLFLLVY